MGTITVTRKELYGQVWSEPMMRLAKRYGVSDVALAKLCRKHDIPRPPRGYWAKKHVGKAPVQTSLPHPTNDYPIAMRDPDERGHSSSTLRQEMIDKVAAERQEDPPIEVAESLRGSHELVGRANHLLQQAEVDDKGLIVPPDDTPLDIHASKASLRRALLIMDALLKSLEQRGYQVDAGPTVEILDVRVGFGISEPLETRREQPEEHNLDGPYSFGHSRFNQKRVPSGRLVLHIHEGGAYWANGCRYTWRETKKQRLEDRLNGFVAGLIAWAARSKEHQLEVEREAQARREAECRRQEEAARRAEKRQQFKAERARVDTLLQQAKDWRQSQSLRDYIEARKQKYVISHGTIEPDGEFAQWLDWATQQADRLDPLVESPPSILDEDIADEEEPKRGYQAWWQNR